MDWTDKTNELMNTWQDAQKQFWGPWYDWVQSSMGGSSAMSSFDPTQFLKAGVDTWSGAAGGTAQRLAGNLLGNPEIMARSVNVLMKAWETVAPKVQAGKPWKPDLEGLLGQWQEEMSSLPNRATATAGEFTQLTRSMFEQWTPITAPWLSMVGQAMASGHPGAAFMGGTAGLDRLMGFEEGIHPLMTGLGELPRGTVIRQKMGKLLEAVDSLTDVRASQAEFHKAMAEAMGKAVEQTMEHLAKLAEKGEPITNVRDLLRTWFGVADKTLNQTFTSAEFMEVQDNMTNALMDHKVKQRAALEIIYQAMEIPTRSEVDEAYRDIHALKKEVRILRRQLKELTQDSKPAPARKAPAARRAPAKKAAAAAT